MDFNTNAEILHFYEALLLQTFSTSDDKLYRLNSLVAKQLTKWFLAHDFFQLACPTAILVKHPICSYLLQLKSIISDIYLKKRYPI